MQRRSFLTGLVAVASQLVVDPNEVRRVYSFGKHYPSIWIQNIGLLPSRTPTSERYKLFADHDGVYRLPNYVAVENQHVPGKLITGIGCRVVDSVVEDGVLVRTGSYVCGNLIKGILDLDVSGSPLTPIQNLVVEGLLT